MTGLMGPDMSSLDLPSDVSLTAVLEDAATPAVLLCDACEHPIEGHDSIGLRFCRATLANAQDRGCICGVK
jgi:hypothetical protein